MLLFSYLFSALKSPCISFLPFLCTCQKQLFFFSDAYFRILARVFTDILAVASLAPDLLLYHLTFVRQPVDYWANLVQVCSGKLVAVYLNIFGRAPEGLRPEFQA